MASEIVMALVGLFCTAVSSLITFFLTKRKYNSEVEAQQIQNVKDSFDTYRNIMEEAIEVQNQKIAALQKENDDLRKQLSLLQAQMVNCLLGKKLDEGISKLSQDNPE
jgi:molecular chaperone GrpE (heat shock protein)